MVIEKVHYGKLPDGRQVDLFTLTNGSGMKVRLTNYGAVTVGVDVPDRDGKAADVTLGYDALPAWLADTCHFGATVGRFANRIAKGKFTLDGQTFALAINNGENSLHGGLKGFDKVLWDAIPVETADSVGMKFTYLSKDGEEGYPGNLKVTAVYSLTRDNEFKAEFSATTDKPTIVNLAHHTYWNLTGNGGAGDVLGHALMLAADRYTPVDAGLIPTGELKDVKGTPMDFTKAVPIGERIAQVEGGYDHNYVLRNQTGRVALAARKQPHHAVPRPIERIDLRAGPADDHHVGRPALDHGGRRDDCRGGQLAIEPLRLGPALPGRRAVDLGRRSGGRAPPVRRRP